jgi:hypothetical protein
MKIVVIADELQKAELLSHLVNEPAAEVVWEKSVACMPLTVIVLLIYCLNRLRSVLIYCNKQMLL